MKKRVTPKSVNLIIYLVTIPVSLLLSGCIVALVQEQKKARELPIAESNFANLQNGTYEGSYAGGRYQWRKNSVVTTILEGSVTDIELIESQNPNGEKSEHEELFKRVIKKQSLQVDAISGATLTSRAYLKAVENSLLQAKTK